MKAAKALKTLPCALTHFGQSECFAQTWKPPLSIIPTFMFCLTRLVDGPSEQVTPGVQRYCYNALAFGLRHHTQGFGESTLEPVREYIRNGLQSQERTVRLAAR